MFSKDISIIISFSRETYFGFTYLCLKYLLFMQIKFYIYTFYKDKTIHTNGNLGAFTCFLLQIHYTYSPVVS